MPAKGRDAAACGVLGRGRLRQPEKLRAARRGRLYDGSAHDSVRVPGTFWHRQTDAEFAVQFLVHSRRGSLQRADAVGLQLCGRCFWGVYPYDAHHTHLQLGHILTLVTLPVHDISTVSPGWMTGNWPVIFRLALMPSW